MMRANKSVIIGWIMSVTSMSLRLERFTTLYNALSSFFPSIRNAQIHVWKDYVTLQAAWENGGCKNSLVNQEMKRVEEMS